MDLTADAPPVICCDEVMLDISTDIDRVARSWRLLCEACSFLLLVTDTDADLTGPTDAPAGSEAKVKVMCARANAGRPLFHPRDNPTLCEPKQDSNRDSPARTLPKGVCWLVSHGKYQARVTVRKRRVFLGYFDSVEAAAAAIERARSSGQKG